jgi:hypothetical protein
MAEPAPSRSISISTGIGSASAAIVDCRHAVISTRSKFRFRLVGSAFARQFGHELTGDVVGAHVSNIEESIPTLRAVGERVFATAQRAFSTGWHETKQGAIHNDSVLLLPLSDGRSRTPVS